MQLLAKRRRMAPRGGSVTANTYSHGLADEAELDYAELTRVTVTRDLRVRSRAWGDARGA